MKANRTIFAIAAAAACVALPSTPGADARPACADRADVVMGFDLGPRDAAGRHARGLFALPDTPSDEVVVFMHGYGTRAGDWADVLAETARRGAVALAMDYRGTGDAPHNRGWPVTTGAEDSIAATQFFLAACPGLRTVYTLGVSMGGNVSGFAAAAGYDKPDGSPLFDYWVSVEGVTNVTETYSGVSARAATGHELSARIRDDIEAEMGGPPALASGTFAEKTLAARARDMAASGLRGAVIVHGVDDGLVPYGQAREMTSALSAAGVPVSLYTVVAGSRGSGDVNASESLGHFSSPLAGHGWGMSHVVVRTGMTVLWSLMDGSAPGPYGEYLVDERPLSPWLTSPAAIVSTLVEGPGLYPKVVAIRRPA